MATTNSNPFDVRVNTATTLATAAAAMTPGSWTTFNCNFVTPGTTPGTLDALLDVGGGKRCTEYADKMVWDPGLRQIYFTGGGHGQQEKTIVYNDDTKTWTDLGSPPWFTVNPGGATHGYQHNTFAGGIQYFMQFATNCTIHTRNVVTGTWGLMNTNGVDLGSTGAIGSLEWFPTFGSGSLILVSGGADSVFRWNGTSWSALAPLPSMGGYHNVGVYSPIKDLLYFGGGNGSSNLYTMSNNGSINAKASCPVEFGIIASITTVDPVSGKLIVASNDKVIRVYDPASNSWSTDTAPPAGFWSDTIYSEGEAMGIVAAPIYDYGVTMFITISGPTIYLRKGR
jgi:WD40 repeat protein